MQIRAAARTLQIHGRQFSTPLIIPSFSSRAKPPTAVSHFLKETLPAIGGPILISAYDVAHQPENPDVDILSEIGLAGLSFVLLDSGGYEVIWNQRAAKAGLIKADCIPEWSPDRYHEVLARWLAEVPLLAVSWDAPNTSIEHQIEAAVDMAALYPKYEVELLLKPSNDEGFNITDIAEISTVASRLNRFPVVGVTEVEIGRSMADRLRFISELRQTLSNNGLEIPIHIFGGLDPLMTPLYHAAGADVFDGLSWLRYAFKENQGVYDKSFAAIYSPLQIEDDQIRAMRQSNIKFLVDLQIRMTRFQSSKDFAALESSGDLLKRVWEACWRS